MKSGEFYRQINQLGAVDWVKKNANADPRFLTGGLVEFLGYATLKDNYPAPEYIISPPEHNADMTKFIPRRDRRSWHLSFPDALIVNNNVSGYPVLFGFAEYKVPDGQHLDDLTDQFDGFNNLHSFFAENPTTATSVVSQMTDLALDTVLVPEEITYCYIVPRDRSTQGIAGSLWGESAIQEIKLPISSHQIYRHIFDIKRRNN